MDWEIGPLLFSFKKKGKIYVKNSYMDWEIGPLLFMTTCKYTKKGKIIQKNRTNENMNPVGVFF